MTRLTLPALATLLLAACAGRPTPLTLRRVVLYQNGIGYFERQGVVQGRTLRIRLRPHELNDVLKTLTVIDRSGERGRAGAVTAIVPRPAKDNIDEKEKGKAQERPVWLEVALGRDGAHDLLIAYSAPTPTWKATYRLVLPERARDRALLQGWALINNASGEDWNRVKLTLATGAPMTFAMDMSSATFVARPDLSGRMVRPVTRGMVSAETARPGDADGDGIGDAKDLCPSAPEDRDGFEDEDGCPEPDNDKDRILDRDDKCPNEPEVYNGYEDEDGCPDRGRIVVHSSNIEILDKIYFAKNADAIKAASGPILDAMAATLKGNPQVRVVEVQGHASSAEQDVWALSARRAGAVRAALTSRGARTELRARAYGATLPVAAGEGEAQQARNRRVELRILERGDEEQEPGPVTAVAARRSATAGEARPLSVAGMVRYELPGQVSIGEGTTTMVTMINRDTNGRDVYLYRPDANVPGSERHPQRAALIENRGKLTLEPGPVAIFARGTFVGEGLLRRLHAGETAYIPYALDGATAVSVEHTGDEKPARLVSVAGGVVTVENHDERVTRYTVETGADVPTEMVIKHVVQPGYKAVDLPASARTTPEGLLITLPIAPTKKSVVNVRERRPVRRTIYLGSGKADRLALYLEGGSVSKAQRAELEQVIKAQRRVARLEERVDRLRQRITDLGVRSGELREHLKALSRTRGAAALRARLLRQISDTVSRLDKLTRELTTADLEHARARDALKRRLERLKIGAAGVD